MYFNLGYHWVKYEKCKKIGFFKRGLGTCVGKLEWFNTSRAHGSYRSCGAIVREPAPVM